jgi:hypothetical protein
MDITVSLFFFDIFLLVGMCWFYFWFYSMFSALADMNDELIALVHKKGKDSEDVGQTKLSDFIEEEE